MLKIQAGSVFHIWCAFCKPPKWKFFVVAYAEPTLRYFIINSNPAAFQRNSRTLLAHQAQLSLTDHSFLKRDSVMDCSEILGGPSASDLEDMYAKDDRVLLGRICTDARRNVRRIVGESELLSAKEIAAILEAW